MSHPSKAKGTAYETALLNYLRESGLEVERLAPKGQKDEGDLVVDHQDGRFTVIEAKNRRKWEFPEFMGEMRAEREEFARSRGTDLALVEGLLVVKAPRKRIGEGYAIRSLAEHFGLAP